ncbi:hypothetical protein PTQ19_10120 [Microbacterium esteraromaticum]|uniref:hypothetical protein n=1 Tax=Microbacterium esteraromaticum TaxID=57043 RepID=UPI002368C721|nr:hypothetical protein [Microbacterium esteraromaticum]WDH77876.1 hypothetical protein PTQ19_10120 [Microbacterium esteraromaticum]
MVIVGTRRSRRPKPTLREIATAVQMLQIAEGAMLHADRDGCFMHGLAAAATRRTFLPTLPKRFSGDPDWMHRHVEAPGMRIQARVDDEVRS